MKTKNKKTSKQKSRTYVSESQKKGIDKFSLLFGSKKVLAIVAILIIASLAGGLAILQKYGDSKAAITETRDPYNWPFAQNSPWNMPIGSGAQFAPANLPYANGLNGRSDGAVYSNGTKIPNGASIDIDPEFIGVNPSDPVKTLNTPYGSTKVHVPPSMSWNGAWNGCATFLGQDNKTIYSGQPLQLSPGGNPYWPYDTSNWPMNTAPLDGIDIKTSDGRVGCHGGSALSGIGGTVRKGDLSGDKKVRHALKFNIDCARLCSNTTADKQPCTPANNSARLCGYRWPSYKADSGQPGHYGGSNPNIKSGSLLALPANTDLSFIQSGNARQLAEAMRDYGIYVVDDTAMDRYGFGVEKGAEWSDGQQFYKDLIEVIRKLQVVTNNGPNSRGGGGNPRTALAPCFAGDSNCSGSSVDLCPNLDGVQTSVPSGKVKDGSGNCVDPQPTDLCPNLDGTQTTIPSGKQKDGSGNCVDTPVVEQTDLCPNLDGVQTSVPSGKVKDGSGNCVDPDPGSQLQANQWSSWVSGKGVAQGSIVTDMTSSNDDKLLVQFDAGKSGYTSNQYGRYCITRPDGSAQPTSITFTATYNTKKGNVVYFYAGNSSNKKWKVSNTNGKTVTKTITVKLGNQTRYCFGNVTINKLPSDSTFAGDRFLKVTDYKFNY